MNTESSPIQTDFTEIYRSHFRPVYAFVAYRVDGRAAAEDLTSQIFEKAWRAFPRFDPRRGEISPWIFTIARNCVVDHLRRQGGKKESSLSEWQEVASDDAAPEWETVALRKQQLQAALKALPEREREILALKFGGGMSNRGIGSLLQLSESNIGTIIYRSLSKLKTQLEGGAQNERE